MVVEPFGDRFALWLIDIFILLDETVLEGFCHSALSGLSHRLFFRHADLLRDGDAQQLHFIRFCHRFNAFAIFCRFRGRTPFNHHRFFYRGRSPDWRWIVFESGGNDGDADFVSKCLVIPIPPDDVCIVASCLLQVVDDLANFAHPYLFVSGDDVEQNVGSAVNVVAIEQR